MEGGTDTTTVLLLPADQVSRERARESSQESIHRTPFPPRPPHAPTTGSNMTAHSHFRRLRLATVVVGGRPCRRRAYGGGRLAGWLQVGNGPVACSSETSKDEQSRQERGGENKKIHEPDRAGQALDLSPHGN